MAKAGRIWGAVEVEQNRAPLGWWMLNPESNRYNREHYIAPLLAQHDAEFEQGRAEGCRLSQANAISYVLTLVAADSGSPSTSPTEQA